MHLLLFLLMQNNPHCPSILKEIFCKNLVHFPFTALQFFVTFKFPIKRINLMLFTDPTNFFLFDSVGFDKTIGLDLPLESDTDSYMPLSFYFKINNSSSISLHLSNKLLCCIIPLISSWVIKPRKIIFK